MKSSLIIFIASIAILFGVAFAQQCSDPNNPNYPCTRCEDDQCTECEDDVVFSLENGKCSFRSQCYNPQHPDYPCVECNGDQCVRCISEDDDYHLNDGKCEFFICNLEERLDCHSCAHDDLTKCLHCKDDSYNHYLHDGACVEHCPDNAVFYDDLNNCANECPGHTFADSSIESHKCIPCDGYIFIQEEDINGNKPRQCIDDCSTVGLSSSEQGPVTGGKECVSLSCTGETPYTDGDNCYAKCPDDKKYMVGYNCYAECPNDKQYVDANNNCYAQCPDDKKYMVGYNCYAECPNDKQYVDANNNCYAQCPDDKKYMDGYNCYAECPDDKKYMVGYNCYAECPDDKNYMDGYNCYAQCPDDKKFTDGYNCYAECPDDRKYMDGYNCYAECPDDKKYMVGYNCYAQCPNDKEYMDGYNCHVECPDDKKFMDGYNCYAECPDDKKYMDGNNCYAQCPHDKKFMDGYACLAECPEGKEPDDNNVCLAAFKCIPVLNCESCNSYGDLCLSCPKGYKLNSGVCVLDCSSLFGSGCDGCNQSQCLSCSTEECCNNLFGYYWDKENGVCISPVCKEDGCCPEGSFYSPFSENCVLCADEWGGQCKKCNANGCVECGDKSYAPGVGSCQQCSDMYGQYCLECNSTMCTKVADGGYLTLMGCSRSCLEFSKYCTKCSAEGGCLECEEGHPLVEGKCILSCTRYCEECGENGTCLSCYSDISSYYFPYKQGCGRCEDNFGIVEMCYQCDPQNGIGCTAAFRGFISGQFSFLCDIIPDESHKLACQQNEGGSIVSMPPQARGTEVNVKYDDYEFSVSCDKLTEHCAECETDANGQTQCSACAPGYALISGWCQSCDSLHMFTFGSNCLECNPFACTKCAEGYYVSNIGWCVQKSYYMIYSNLTKLYLPYYDDCSGLIPHCSLCESEDRCTECQNGYILDVDGRCKPCSLLFDGNCSVCVNSSVCLECYGDSCCGENEFFYSWNKPCVSCTDLFGENCAECTRASCLACKQGDSCKDTCSNLFEGCFNCSAWECTSCSDPDWVLTPNGCHKAVEHHSDPSEEDGGLGAGAIAGIVIACVVFVAIAVAACWCCVAVGAGKKRGDVDEEIYEEDKEFVSMSML